MALLLSESSFACLGELEVFPTAVISNTITPGKCFAFINLAQTMTQHNPFCILDEMEIQSKGIEVGLNKYGACNYLAGRDQLSGVVEKLPDGSLRLR